MGTGGQKWWGCAISPRSNLWFTLGRGIVNEVYHPWVDHAAIRDLGFIVAADDGFLSEEQKDCEFDTQMIAPGVPAYKLTNRCVQGRYQITKEIFADPKRSVLLQRIRFVPLRGSLADYRIFVLTSPRLGDQGNDNSGWLGSFHGTQMLFARYQGHAMALAGSVRWAARSVGFVGISDAWQDVKRHGQMCWRYDRADRGHIALGGQIDLQLCGGEFILALAFDRSPAAAALNASLSLHSDFDDIQQQYQREWSAWHQTLKPLDHGNWAEFVSSNQERCHRLDSSRPRKPGGPSFENIANLYRTSAMVLRVHRSKGFDGASVASLAVPWGDVRGQDDRGGYHLVWPRDLVEESFGFLAAGSHEEARSVLNYLRVTQKTDGGWSQDMWLDGAPYADAVQLDEIALPILLVDLAYREKAIEQKQVKSFWPMVRAAAACLLQKGPSTGEDRWENTPGLSPYTLATEIAALLVAAKLADHFGEIKLATYLRQTADLWIDQIESWTYVTGTPLAREAGVDGCYIRIAPSPGISEILERGDNPTEKQARHLHYSSVVSPDALALVRFGLRAADDPKIANTVKVIDSLNRTETPAGPCWRRYNGGYYGESSTGEPFTGTGSKSGHGRAWPLLTGERGHYEIASGNFEGARNMLRTMNRLGSQIGLLPEQVWDSEDIPDKFLFLGRPSGSAMPLAWTHSEYVRLLRSLHDKMVFDRPNDAWNRYVKQSQQSSLALWRFDHQPKSFSAGRSVRVELLAAAVVRYTTDQWQTFHDAATTDSECGIHFADLPSSNQVTGQALSFTFRRPAAGDRWEGQNFTLAVKAECHE